MRRHSWPVSSRRSEKALRDAILARARQHDLDARVLAQTAYRLFLLREAATPTAEREGLEMTHEEEAGAILDAEMANDLSLLRQCYEAVHKS